MTEINIVPIKRMISWSEMNSFARCKRQWYSRYVKRLRPKREAATESKHMGKLIHEGLESFYKGDGWIGKIEEAQTLYYPPGMTEDQVKKVDKTLAISQAVLGNYEEWVEETGQDDDLEVIDVEKKLTLKDGSVVFGHLFPSDWGIKGYVDLVVYNKRTGQVSIMEHKTTIDTYATWLSTTMFTLTWQAKLYILMLEAANPGLNISVIFNVLRRIKGTPRATKPWFWRYETSFGREEMERAKEVFGFRAREIEGQLYQPEDWMFPNPSRMCSICEYQTICPSFDTESKPQLNDLLEEFFEPR